MSVLKAVIFDLDNTLISTNALREYRETGRFKDIDDDLRGKTKIYLPVINMLKKLKDAGIKLAILTNSPRAYALPLLKHHNLHNFFDAVVTYDDVGSQGKKPSPKGLNEVLRALSIPKAENAIYVGDDTIDVIAAYRAGMRPITPTWATRSSVTLAPYASLSSAAILELVGDAEEFMLFAERCATHESTDFKRSSAHFLALDENADIAPIRTRLRTFCLGRYFSQKSATTALMHDRHSLSLEIARKDDDVNYQPPEWVAEMLFKIVKASPQYLFNDGQGIDIVTIIPRKPQKPRRLEIVLDRMREFAAGIGMNTVFDPGVFFFDEDSAPSLRGHGAHQRLLEQQAHLHLRQRRVAGKNIIVIDDVVTTGATINRALSLLDEAGCSAAFGLGIAKTVSIVEDTKPCPKCQRDMLIRKNQKTGVRFWSCSGFLAGKLCSHTEDIGTVLCPKCGRPMRLQVNSKDKSKFQSCTGWNKTPKCSYTFSVKHA